MHGYKDQNAVDFYIKERRRFGWKIRGERAVKYANIKCGDMVLDLCCGPGMVTKIVRRIIGEKGFVMGIDSSSGFIKYARFFCRYKNARFVKGNVEQLEKCTGGVKFDAVILLASWFWIKNKKRLLREVAKCLKPGGTFLVSVSGDDLYDKLTSFFCKTYRKNIICAIKKRIAKVDLSYFRALPKFNSAFVNRMVRMIERAGFKLVATNETTRLLNFYDKLYTYRNPARTEWVGKFNPTVRYEIIKEALTRSWRNTKKLEYIKRHTHYLKFSKK